MRVAASPSCVVFYASSVRAMGEMGCGEEILILRGFFLLWVVCFGFVGNKLRYLVCCWICFFIFGNLSVTMLGYGVSNRLKGWLCWWIFDYSMSRKETF
jgi:hypothetical protein